MQPAGLHLPRSLSAAIVEAEYHDLNLSATIVSLGITIELGYHDRAATVERSIRERSIRGAKGEGLSDTAAM
jgi:hypothetical protein